MATSFVGGAECRWHSRVVLQMQVEEMEELWASVVIAIVIDNGAMPEKSSQRLWPDEAPSSEAPAASCLGLGYIYIDIYRRGRWGAG